MAMSSEGRKALLKKVYPKNSAVASNLRDRGATTGEAKRYGDMRKKMLLAAAKKRGEEGRKRKAGETDAEYKARMARDKFGNPRE